MLIGCHRSVAPVKDADVAGLVPSWCATSHRRQRRRRHQPRRRRQATLGLDRPQDSNAKGVPGDSATPLVSESVMGVFLGSPAATPRLESETPVAFDRRPTCHPLVPSHKMRRDEAELRHLPIPPFLRPPARLANSKARPHDQLPLSHFRDLTNLPPSPGFARTDDGARWRSWATHLASVFLR